MDTSRRTDRRDIGRKIAIPFLTFLFLFNVLAGWGKVQVLWPLSALKIIAMTNRAMVLLFLCLAYRTLFAQRTGSFHQQVFYGKGHRSDCHVSTNDNTVLYKACFLHTRGGRCGSEHNNRVGNALRFDVTGRFGPKFQYNATDEIFCPKGSLPAGQTPIIPGRVTSCSGYDCRDL